LAPTVLDPKLKMDSGDEDGDVNGIVEIEVNGNVNNNNVVNRLFPVKPKRKLRDPDSWRKNVNKRLKCEGKKYLEVKILT